MPAYIIPPAIIFVNQDISQNTRAHLEKQLFITESYFGEQFDVIYANNPDLKKDLMINNERIMVFRSFDDYTNRKVADIAMFVSRGLINVEKNNFGPPNLSLPVSSIYWGAMCKFYFPRPYADNCCNCDHHHGKHKHHHHHDKKYHKKSRRHYPSQPKKHHYPHYKK